MMHEFLAANRLDLIERCKAKVAIRVPGTTIVEMDHGIPLFIDQLIKTLQLEQSADPMRSRKVSGASGGGEHAFSEMSAAATEHGRELMKRGFTIEQVVHDYGDLCQAITDLAFEQGASIEIDEFRTLNRCLDNAIAVAVTEFTYQRDFRVAETHTSDLNERLGMFSHEVRNLLNTATLALSTIKARDIGLGGATGAVLERSLIRLRHLIDRSLSEVRMTAGLAIQYRLFSLADFIGEIKFSAALEAKMRGCTLSVSIVDRRLAVDADRDLLFSAVGNLLQNAFKFSRADSAIMLSAYAAADRIFIDVEDGCGGLPPGEAENMFKPFTQGGGDRTGLGLGLSIARRSVEANAGKLSVRNVPGSGCVFTIDIPRHTLPKQAPLVYTRVQ
jgi:signal transduction histidine kinase